MKHWSRVGMSLIGIVAASVAGAECSVSADQGASVRVVTPVVEADAELIVAMTMVPKLLHVDYRTAAKRPSCDLGPLAVENGTYTLWGTDKGSRERKALPARKGEPIALLIPVFDIIKAIEGSQSGTAAQVDGYMLATVSKNDLTAWRFYTGVPDVTVLRRDMVEALGSRGSPIFRKAAGNQTTIFVPKP